MPGQEHAAISAAKDKGFKPFTLGHGNLRSWVLKVIALN
jgi:hypothetical protein